MKKVTQLNCHPSPSDGRCSVITRASRALKRISLIAALLAVGVSNQAFGQITNVVFSENFESGTIDPNKFVPDTPFFEGGKGTFNQTVANGVVEFTGEVTQQWWPGATLRTVPSFVVSPETNIVVSVDRVYELGTGTASRSALFIMNDAQTAYVLFSDVRAEGGWSFNRKIGVGGDNPTGSGTQMTAFDGWDDGGLYTMKAVANGRTVRLYLNDTFGAEVQFPYTNLLFHIGTFARANGDLSQTAFDNFKVESVGKATFSVTDVSLQAGQTLSDVVVKIPPGLNATAAVQVTVVSTNPAAATPAGGTNGRLTLTFPAGGANTQTFGIQAIAQGGTAFQIESTIGLESGNTLRATVVPAAGVRLQDAFADATIDATKWEVNNRAFETDSGTFEVTQAGGTLNISGTLTDAQYWGGASLKTVSNFVATKDLNLSVEVDRVSIEQVGTAGRSGVFLTTADRSHYVFLSENVGEGGWQVNVKPGNPTGGGTVIAPFANINDLGNHKIKLVANGQTVGVYLDGIFGGSFPFDVASGIHVELGAYARAFDDTVSVAFDNVRIENTLPCITTSETTLSIVQGDPAPTANIIIPRLLNSASAASVRIVSRNPQVAVAAGAANGTLTLNFAAGASNVQPITISAVGVGNTVLDIVGPDGSCVDSSISVSVSPAPQTLLTDNFSGATLDASKWRIDENPFESTGFFVVDESNVTVSNGAVRINVTAEIANWPGLAVFTTDTFTAGPTAPLSFEIDRVSLGFDLVTGTAAKQRAGAWIANADRSQWVFFTESATHDGTAGGWTFHRNIGQAGDNPTTGTAIQAFTAANFNDRGNHKLKLVANGSTVKLYLDNVFGTEVAFPLTEGITFGFGAYVQAATDIVHGVFDNAKITGGVSNNEGLGSITVSQNNGQVVLSWTSDAVLQSADALATPTVWTDVSPAPAGKTHTVNPAQGTQKFYRLKK